MGEHSQSGAGRPEPVAIAATVQAVLAALVTLGWVQLDDAQLASIGTVVAVVAGTAITLAARRRVTPISNPTAEDGTPLVPATSSAGREIAATQLLEREGRTRGLA
jgi:hypothetical protein